MAFAPDVRLGPYEVLAPVGAGGMGEVYRARDPRLAREVAIKVLPIPAVLCLRERPVANPEVRLELTTPATRQPLHFAKSPDEEGVQTP